MRYHLTPVRMTVVEKIRNNKRWQGCREKGTLVHCWWKCKLVRPLWKTEWRFLKRLKIEVPYNLAIPLLGIYVKKVRTLIQRDACTTMFIAALFTVVKIWKQPRCPSTDKWIKKMWSIYTMEYYITINKEWDFAICNNLDGPGGYFAYWSKSDRERQILYVFTYMWNLNK